MRNIYIAFLFFACIGCKYSEKKPTTVEKSVHQNDIAITKAIENLLKLGNGDKITFDINLTMEHFIRVDTVVVKKENDSLYISATTDDKVEDLDDDFVRNKIPWKTYSLKYTDTLSLEHFFSKKIDRTDKNDAHTYTANIFTEYDTISLYTYNLAEKARFIKEYFRIMANVFPEEKMFEHKNQTITK